jgi:hypothetical protein
LGRVGRLAVAGDAANLGATGPHPVVRHHFKWQRVSMAAGLCYRSLGGASVAFHHQQGAYNTDTLIGALQQPRLVLGGQKATLVWGNLPARTSLAMRAWLADQRAWLTVEYLPAW